MLRSKCDGGTIPLFRVTVKRIFVTLGERLTKTNKNKTKQTNKQQQQQNKQKQTHDDQ